MLEKGVEAFLKATYKMRESVVTKSAKETASFGYLLGKTLQPGYIVGLIGGIGAGKTCLAGGIAGA
ncbi:MAG TPA: tRNA (adenosine(37)-N6)-threonylcarbamoyltransferase complex ATPase subunit type 1 TsaE, partial [Candidatus Goldiibacteriota bacterium]|nr:tRNA (adenosine(37)-N6)-threonylcarbamoyltransferase complex ATPase subunit type 1 TsaE [Candidatus Goldiibacteriota bacterium]